MAMYKLTEVYAIIPVAMLLTVSFFVLFAARKADTKNLKVFGQAVAVLLWVAAALVLFAGISLSSCKTYKKTPMKHEMMRQGGKMPHDAMRYSPPPPIQQQK